MERMLSRPFVLAIVEAILTPRNRLQIEETTFQELLPADLQRIHAERMALKWVMRDGAVTSVLVGASRPEQLIENCRAFEGSPLGEEELVRIDAATAGL